MPSRRQLLAASSLAVVASAGCLGSDDEPDEPEPSDDAEANDTAVSTADPDAPLVTTVDRRTADDDDEDTEEIVLATYGGVDAIDDIEYDDTQNSHYVSIRFTDETTDRFVSELEAIDAFADPMNQEIQVHVDGDVIGSYALGPNLAATMEDREWEGSFSIVAEEAELEELRGEFDGS